jgi:hypothetical protein
MVRLIVNGKHKFVGFTRLSHEQVVTIANEDRPTPWNGLHTVTYRYRDARPAGELAPGESVDVADEMVFNAHATGNA